LSCSCLLWLVVYELPRQDETQPCEERHAWLRTGKHRRRCAHKTLIVKSITGSLFTHIYIVCDVNMYCRFIILLSQCRCRLVSSVSDHSCNQLAGLGGIYTRGVYVNCSHWKLILNITLNRCQWRTSSVVDAGCRKLVTWKTITCIAIDKAASDAYLW